MVFPFDSTRIGVILIIQSLPYVSVCAISLSRFYSVISLSKWRWEDKKKEKKTATEQRNGTHIFLSVRAQCAMSLQFYLFWCDDGLRTHSHTSESRRWCGCEAAGHIFFFLVFGCKNFDSFLFFFLYSSFLILTRLVNCSEWVHCAEAMAWAHRRSNLMAAYMCLHSM